MRGDAGGEGGEVAVGEVGAADPLVEEDVAPEHHRRHGPVDEEHHMARRVAGDRPDLEIEAGDREAFPVVEEAVGRRAGDRQAEQPRKVPHRIDEF